MYPGFEQVGINASPDPSLIQLAFYAFGFFLGLKFLLTVMAVFSLPIFFGALWTMEFSIACLNNLPDPIGKFSKIFGLVFRSLRRNLLRTALTYVALFVLTGLLAFMYSAVTFLDEFTKEKENNVQVIMTERFGAPSMMPRGYVNQLKATIESLPKESQPKSLTDDFMVWSFVGATLDKEKRTKENTIFMLAMEPNCVLTMLDYQGLSITDLSEESYKELEDAVKAMQEDKRNIIVGKERLEVLGKKVGDTIKAYSLGYKDIVFDVKIVGSFPAESRWGGSAVMRLDYFNDSLDASKGNEAIRPVNLIWVRMPNRESYEQLASIVNDPKRFSGPQTKMETASAAIGSFLEPLKDIVWGMKYLIMPAIAIIMCLVISITITIGVRERRTEMAVMKVLGFLPWQILFIVIAEAILVGVMGGLLSSWSIYFSPRLIDFFKTELGIKVPLSFFANFKAPIGVVIYGPLLGIVVGIIGSFAPSWSSQKVKVSEVFSQVT
ncbi:MAG: ABC transporter permease [Fimbriiglobus sp.]